MLLNKKETVARLTAKLIEATAIDEKALAQHYADNEGVAAKRREQLKGLLKLSDNELAEISYNFYLEGKDACPRSLAKPIQRELDWIGLVEDETLTVRVDSPLMNIMRASYSSDRVC